MCKRSCLPLCLVSTSLTLLPLVACSPPDPSENPFAVDTAEAPRLDAVVAVTRDELLDDFEDGDLEAWLPDGEGYFIAEGAADSVAIVAEGDTGDSSLSVAPEAGRLLVQLSPEGAPLRRHDYSSCSGVELMIRHDGAAGARAIDLEVVSATGTGTVSLEVTEAWQVVGASFAELGAPATGVGGAGNAGGAGGAAGAPAAGSSAGGSLAGDAGAGGGGATPTSFDPSSVLALSLAALADANLLVDSIHLTDCELLPLNPPLPAPATLGTGAPTGSPVAQHGQLRVVGNRLLDQAGEPVQLKGVSSMWLSLEDDGYARSLATLEFLRDDWGLSVFRAAMSADEFNGYVVAPSYARDEVETIIQNAIELGVYVIVDFHSHHAEEYGPEARAFFADIAARYGEHPNVIYEPYNEPTRQEWSPTLKPYHESVIAAIRAEDPDNLIVAGNRQWSQLPNEASLAPIGASNLLYTLHFYSCTHDAWLRANAEAALAAGVALFVTEWGGTDADGGVDGLVCEDEAVAWLEWMEERQISWAAWKLDDGGDSTSLLEVGVRNGGGWTDAQLNGHAPLVREWMRR